MVVVFWLPDPPNICMDSCQLIFKWQQAVQEGTLCGFTNGIPKLALRKCLKPAKCPLQSELLTFGVVQQVLVIELCLHHLQFFLHQLGYP